MANGQVVLVTTEPLGGGSPVRSVYYVAEQDPAKAEAIIAAMMAPNERVEAWGPLPERAVKAAPAVDGGPAMRGRSSGRRDGGERMPKGRVSESIAQRIIDLVAPIGTKVVAPADGIVTRVGVSGGFGNSIFVSHGYGIITRYGHLAGYNVKVGQRIKRGDVIGMVGTSGRSTGPHLHYEVLVHQRNVDPVKYILDEYRSF